MAIYAVDIEPPQPLSLSRPNSIAESRIKKAEDDAFAYGIAKRLFPRSTPYDYTPPDYGGRVGVIVNDDGTGAVVISKRRGWLSRVISRRSEFRVVESHRLPPEVDVYIGKIETDNSATLGYGGRISLVDYKQKVVRSIIAYRQRGEQSADEPTQPEKIPTRNR